MAAEDHFDIGEECARYHDCDREDLSYGYPFTPRRSRPHGSFDISQLDEDDIKHTQHFGIAKETDLAILFFSDMAKTKGFWMPKSIIVDKVMPRNWKHTTHAGVSHRVKPGRVYFPLFHDIVEVKISMFMNNGRYSAKEDFQSFAEEFKHYAEEINSLNTPTTSKENTMQHVKTNHMLSMFQENYTTILVAYVGEPMKKLFTYKAPMDHNLQIGDEVIVPVGDADEFGFQAKRLARVELVHSAPEIDYDSNIVYRWVIQKVDYTRYNEILETEKKFKELMVQADKLQHKKKLREAFLELATDEEAKSLMDQALKLVGGKVIEG